MIDAMPRAAGKIQVKITYLETKERPPRAVRQIPHENVTIMLAVHPTVSFYRFLYNTVGQPWLWYERRQMSDEALRQIIQHPQVEVHVLYAGGVPAGYAELDWRQAPDVELAYFGLMPEFIGKGFGALLIDEMHEKVWLKQPQRFWLHTCTLDHPQALAFYQRAGFVPYRQEVNIIDDPRTLRLM